jgi:anti-anti-sigma factor
MKDLFTCELDGEKGMVTVAFSGRMDTVASEKVTAGLKDIPQIANISDDGTLLHFDLSGVEYIASSFVRICVGYAKLAQPGKFSIVNCQPFVKKTFKISGLDGMLNIV